LEGTVVEEKITHMAGATSPQFISKKRLIDLIRKAGKIPVERDALYNRLRVYH
ncbi:MAG: aminofutalosine synthase MqnE, partial [Aquificota bacterium]